MAQTQPVAPTPALDADNLEVVNPDDPDAPRENNRMPFGRWFQEIGWRHLVGVLALIFAAFPVLYVISASLNPLGTVASTSIIPKQVSLANYQTLLSGARAPSSAGTATRSSCASSSLPSRSSSRSWPPTPSAASASRAAAAAS